MFLKSTVVNLALFLAGTSQFATAREVILERDGRPVSLYPRRFGRENPPVIAEIGAACPGQVCGVLAGAAITPLLAAQPECSQQDMADAIIDASKQFDAATQAKMIELAKIYRQTEKNTPPDFSTDPPAARNSVFCQKAPKNAELNGLVQAQDPNNDPELFFDPALKATVRKGSAPNTAPFNGAAAAPAASSSAATATAATTATDASETLAATTTDAGTALPAETANTGECPTAVTITVTGAAATATSTSLPTVVVGDPSVAPLPAGVDFGSCTTPEIEFGQGFDNRRETSFQPKVEGSFRQGSAQNINIITRAMCDTLTNSCGANQAAKDLCAVALAKAAEATPAKTGIQADVFNAEFGITTNFAQVQPFDDQGRPVSTDTAPASSTSVVAEVPSVTTTPESSTTVASTPAPAETVVTGGGGQGGDFGKCTPPQIVFAQGLDGRKETSFAPADKVSFNHGSAQNIDIITQFICDSLTNTCGADAAAKATCAQATAAASAATKGSGAQADSFNKLFGFTTNFAQVQQIDNQGRPVGPNLNSSTPPANAPAAGGPAAGGPAAGGPAAGGPAAGGPAAGGNLQTFEGSLGDVVAPTVTALENGQFQVQNNASFNNLRSARVRSCDVQNNQCANAANGSGNRNFTVAQCNAQQAQCIAQAGN